MIVVSDASPIISLAAVRQFDLLHKLYAEIIIPDAVRDEIASRLLLMVWVSVEVDELPHGWGVVLWEFWGQYIRQSPLSFSSSASLTTSRSIFES